VDAAALVKIKELVAALEVEFVLITQEISKLQEEKMGFGYLFADLEAKFVLVTREISKLQEEQVCLGHIITAWEQLCGREGYSPNIVTTTE
jgi:hypothetical protein